MLVVFFGMCVRIGRVGVLMTNKVNRKRQSGGGDNCQNKYRKGCSAGFAMLYQTAFAFPNYLLTLQTIIHTCIQRRIPQLQSRATQLYLLTSKTPKTQFVFYISCFTCLVFAFVFVFGDHCICMLATNPLYLSHQCATTTDQQSIIRQQVRGNETVFLYLLAVVFVFVDVLSF